MKIRFTENSLRIRMRKSEIAQLTQTDWVATQVAFPQQILRFEVCIVAANFPLQAVFEAATIALQIPRDAAEQWLNTQQVGIYANLPVDTVQGPVNLNITLEKDFPCAHRPDENKADTFEELAAQQGQALGAGE